MGLIDRFDLLIDRIERAGEVIAEVDEQLNSAETAVQDVLAFDSSRGGFDQGGFRAGGVPDDGFDANGFRAGGANGLAAAGTLTTAQGVNSGVLTGADVAALADALGAVLARAGVTVTEGGGGSGGGREAAARAGIEAFLAFMSDRYGFTGSQTTGFGLVLGAGLARGGR